MHRCLCSVWQNYTKLEKIYNLWQYAKNLQRATKTDGSQVILSFVTMIQHFLLRQIIQMCSLRKSMAVGTVIDQVDMTHQVLLLDSKIKLDTVFSFFII